MRITAIAETRQLEDGSWKSAVWHPDEEINEFLAKKKEAKGKGIDLDLDLPKNEAKESTIESLDGLVDQIMIMAAKLKAYSRDDKEFVTVNAPECQGCERRTELEGKVRDLLTAAAEGVPSGTKEKEDIAA